MPRLARGCRCYAAFEGDSVVGYGWLSTGPEWIGELQLLITPGPSEGYMWNCVTLPEHRRRGVYRSILARLPELARRDGLHRLWTGSVAIPAEKAVGPAGFRPALHFDTLTGAEFHLMLVTAGADRDLAANALRVLNTKLGVHARRSHPRRH